MDFTFVIIIVAAVIFIGLFFTLVKNIIKALVFSFVLLVLISLLIGGFFYMDFHNFAKDIFVKDKLFLLEDNNEIVAGLRVREVNESAFTAESNYISERKLEEYSMLYKNDNYKEMLENYYRLFIFKNEAFNINLEGDKNQAFADFLEEKLKEQSYIFILKEFKNGNIIIYPKTFLFKIAEISPVSLIDKLKERFTNA